MFQFTGFASHTYVIVGGESGKGARPLHPDWARRLRDQCKTNGIPFFFKQWGEWAPVDHLAWITDGTTFARQPMRFGDMVMARVGKGMAGHVLDGVEWRQPPSPALPPTAGERAQGKGA